MFNTLGDHSILQVESEFRFFIFLLRLCLDKNKYIDTRGLVFCYCLDTRINIYEHRLHQIRLLVIYRYFTCLNYIYVVYMYKFSQKDAYMIFNKSHKINSRLARTLVQWFILNYYEILNKALR